MHLTAEENEMLAGGQGKAVQESHADPGRPRKYLWSRTYDPGLVGADCRGELR